MPSAKRTSRANASSPMIVAESARKTRKINLNPHKTCVVLKKQNTMAGRITRAAQIARWSQPKTLFPDLAKICMTTRLTQIRTTLFASLDGSRKFRLRQNMTSCKLTLEPIRCKVNGHCPRNMAAKTDMWRIINRNRRLTRSLPKTAATQISALVRRPASPARKKQRCQSSAFRPPIRIHKTLKSQIWLSAIQ